MCIFLISLHLRPLHFEMLDPQSQQLVVFEDLFDVVRVIVVIVAEMGEPVFFGSIETVSLRVKALGEDPVFLEVCHGCFLISVLCYNPGNGKRAQNKSISDSELTQVDDKFEKFSDNPYK